MTGPAFRVGAWCLRLWAWACFLFLLTPMLIVLPMSFNSGNYLTFPPEGFSARWYARFFQDPEWIAATLLSLRIGAYATLAALVLGVLLAIAIVREKLPGAALIEMAALAPMIVPVIVYTVGVYYLFAGWHFTGSALSIAIPHTVMALPYVVILVTAALRQFDFTQELAAYGMGAGRWRTMWHVILPQIMPSILAAALFAFITSFDDLIVALFLSGFNPTLPQKMYENIRIDIDPTISAVSVLQIAAVALCGLVALRWNRRMLRRG